MLDTNAYIPGSSQDEPLFWNLITEWNNGIPSDRLTRTWPGASRVRPYADPWPKTGFSWFTKAGSS